MTRRFVLPPAVVAVFVGSLFVAVPGANAAAPANDNFSSPTPINGASGTTSGTNVEATGESGEPENHTDALCNNNLPCGDLGDSSVWYSWTAPSTGTFAFDTYGTDSLATGIDSVLGVYTGTLGALTEVGFNDDYARTCCESRVLFPATTGAIYTIAVSGCCGVPDSDEGAFTLNWAVATRPGNDNFASATAISGASGSLASQTNYDGSPQAGELSAHQSSGNPPTDLGGASIWYSWTAPSTAVFAFRGTSGVHSISGGFTPVLAAYTGSLGSLSEVAYSTNGTLVFSATSGTPYAIGAGGCCGYWNGAYWGDMGTFTLEWLQDTTAPNTSIASTSRGFHAVTFTFTGSDDLSSFGNLDFECKLDAAAFAACTASSMTYSNITGGPHTVSVRAVDESGNVDPTPASATIRAKGSPKNTG